MVWHGMVWYGLGLNASSSSSSWSIELGAPRRAGGAEVGAEAAQAGDVARAGGGAAEVSSEASVAEAAEAEAVGAVGAAGGSGGGGRGRWSRVGSGEASPPAVDKGLRH